MIAVRKQRVWTDEQRQSQSRILRERQIWLKSTGPKTDLGKCVSSRNACKPDYAERVEMKHIMRYLRTQKSYTDLLKFFIKQKDRMQIDHKIMVNLHLQIFENELIDLELKLRSGFQKSGHILSFPVPPPP